MVGEDYRMRAFMNFGNWQNEIVIHGHTRNSLTFTKQELQEARSYIASLEKIRDDFEVQTEQLTAQFNEN